MDDAITSHTGNITETPEFLRQLQDLSTEMVQETGMPSCPVVLFNFTHTLSIQTLQLLYE